MSDDRSRRNDSSSAVGEDAFAGRVEGRAARNEPMSPTSTVGRDSEMPKTTEDLRQASLWSDAWRQLRRNKLFLVAATLLSVLSVMAAFPQLFTSIGPIENCQLSNSKLPPGTNGAWFGYDIFGCDYYANVIYGARVSMLIGVFVMGGAMIIGVTLGALSGYYGGWFDTVIARITDIVYGLPLILGAILILNVFTERGLLQVGIALIVLSWMTFLRLFRSSVITVKETDYVAAARGMGAGSGRILLRHVLPNAIAPVLVYATIFIGGVIAAEATLSFLGIGLQLPAVSWGLQIGSGQRILRTAPHIIFFPSIFLSITVLSFILLGDALRDALDPKLR